MLYGGGLLGRLPLALVHCLASQLQGTQPNELATLPEPSHACGCHLDYEPSQDHEPGQTYAGTAMSLATRDPLFRAALAVAQQDRPELTPNCLRCHTPRGWLAGRAIPGDGSALLEEDLQGVTCDVCHRMVPAPDGPLIGGGQITLSQSASKQGPRSVTPGAHGTQVSDFIATSEACGACHSLFNPLERHHDPDGNEYGFAFYEQRTYEEWRDSDFRGRQSCADCHLKRVEAYSCSERVNLYPDMRQHAIVGGNTWITRAVAVIEPQLMLQDDVDRMRRWLAESMASAARLEITGAGPGLAEAEQGGALEVGVRFTNLTGHKLPTGYPEGRRIYLEVTLQLEGRAPEIISGVWDRATGNVIPDSQLRTYEAGHGIVGSGRSFHLALANQSVYDTRIPPENFRPQHGDMVPIGRDYGAAAPYRHWDEHRYSIPIPADVPLAATGTVTIRAMRQALTGQYFDFLMNELPEGTAPRENLRRAYNALGKVPPDVMTTVSLPLVVVPRRAPPDAGVPDSAPVVAPDASAPPAHASGAAGGGCACAARRDPAAGAGLLLAGLLLAAASRRRRLPGD